MKLSFALTPLLGAALLAGSLIAAVISGCGDEDDKDKSAPPKVSGGTVTPPPAAGKGGPGASCADYEDCFPQSCVCPDGAGLEIRVCTNAVCRGTEACAEQCLSSGHGSLPTGACSTANDCETHFCACPDGWRGQISQCLNGSCVGAEGCLKQCCDVGHCG